MKIFIGADHAGFELKKGLKPFLAKLGHEVIDCGAEEFSIGDDYPDFIQKVAEKVLENPDSRGIILGKSGQGEAMCANRNKGIRATVYYGGSNEILELSRAHNGSNVLSLGAGFLTPKEAEEAVAKWLSVPFSGEERHIRRLAKF